MFTKRHYNEIADALRTVRLNFSAEGMPVYSFTVNTFIHMFKEDNPKFNAGEFLEAIYGGDKE